MAKRANNILVGLGAMYISLDGRIRRSEYWLAAFALGLIQVVFTLVLMGLAGFASPAAKIIELAIRVIFLWPSFALMTKRGHDRGRSAWFTLMCWAGPLFLIVFAAPIKVLFGDLVALIVIAAAVLFGLFIVLDYGFGDGDPGRNRFGYSPKAPGRGRPLSLSDDPLPGGEANA